RVNAGESLSAYVYIDPANPPSEIMISWNTTAGDWEHRAYWGANNISYGTDGTAGRRYVGPLPAAGQWARCVGAASSVGLEGAVLQGMDFAVFNGRVTWDFVGTDATSGGGTSDPPTSGITNSSFDNSEFDALAMPVVGQSMLRVLSPTLLEL